MQRRLLLVEDDLADQHVITRALNGEWAITVAQNLSEGLAQAQLGGWACVITDLHLPDIGNHHGAGPVERLVQVLGSEVPVLVLTGNLAPGQQHDLLAAGAWITAEKGCPREGDLSGEQLIAIYATRLVVRAEAHAGALKLAFSEGRAAGLVAGQATALASLEQISGRLDRFDQAHASVGNALSEERAAWVAAVERMERELVQRAEEDRAEQGRQRRADRRALAATLHHASMPWWFRQGAQRLHALAEWWGRLSAPARTAIQGSAWTALLAGLGVMVSRKGWLAGLAAALLEAFEPPQPPQPPTEPPPASTPAELP